MKKWYLAMAVLICLIVIAMVKTVQAQERKVGIGLNYTGLQVRYEINQIRKAEAKIQFASNNTLIGGRIIYQYQRISGKTLMILCRGLELGIISSEYLTSGVMLGAFWGFEIMATERIGVNLDAGPYYVGLKSSLGEIDDIGLIFNLGVTYYF